MTKIIVHNAIKAFAPIKGIVQIWTRGFIEATGTNGNEPIMPIKGKVHDNIHSYCFMPEKIIQVKDE